MKTRLNLSIEDNILTKMRAYAKEKQISLSKLVEEYFLKEVTKSKSKNFIELVEGFEKPQIAKDADLKDYYYEERRSKYGF